MRRRRRRVGLLLASASAGLWLGCNALLDIDRAELDGSDGGNGRDDGAWTDVLTDATIPSDADGPRDAGEVRDGCVDLDTNPRHCGRCGRDCLGGACSAGRCQPVAVSATEPGEPLAILSDGQWVYWTNATSGDIRRARTDGGPIETVYDGPPNTSFGTRLLKRGNEIFFSQYRAGLSDGGVFRCAASGCGSAANVVARDLTEPRSLEDDGNTLVVAHGGTADSVFRCTLSACPVRDAVATNDPLVQSVAITGTTVAWFTLASGGALRVDLGGTVITARRNLLAGELAFRSGRLVFAELGRGIATALIDGGDFRTVSSVGNQTEYFVLDSNEVFYTNRTPGLVVRAGFNSAPDAGEVLARDQAGPRDIALDAVQLYWTNEGNAASQLPPSVMRVVR